MARILPAETNFPEYFVAALADPTPSQRGTQRRIAVPRDPR